jgi:hypothetical protein
MTKNPWDAPSRPTAYDLDTEILMAAVGSALSAWQYTEDVIADIFESILTDCSPKGEYVTREVEYMTPARRAYGSIVSFDGRAGMVQAAAEAFFEVHKNGQMHTRLRKLLQSCRGWSARRNEVAHGQIGGSPMNLNMCALWPWGSSMKKRAVDYRASFVYNSAQIKEFERQFFVLQEQLMDFRSDFFVWRQGPFEEHLEQTLGQPPD